MPKKVINYSYAALAAQAAAGNQAAGGASKRSIHWVSGKTDRLRKRNTRKQANNKKNRAAVAENQALYQHTTNADTKWHRAITTNRIGRGQPARVPATRG